MGFDPLLSLIAPGAPVAPGTVNGPLGQLSGDVNYLWQLFQALNLGSTVFLPAAPVEPAAQIGMPVYYNPTAGRYERALAAAAIDPVSGRFTTAASALWWGIVQSKQAATVAQLLLFGTAPVNLTAAAGSPGNAGLYYLSAATPGGLTQARPAVPIPVLRCDGGGNVMVCPQVVDINDSHQHYHVALVCRPAGTTAPPLPGERHVMTGGNAALAGWLPATHASFNGLAPPLARFGYNVAADVNLAPLWPPVPPQGAYLEWNRGNDPTEGGEGVPLGPLGQALIDRNGIWWLTDCYQDVPWPWAINTADPYTPPDASESTAGDVPHCPREVDMALNLWFTRVNFVTDGTAVTSLISADPRLTVACQGSGSPASVGALQLALNLGFMVAPGVTRGGTVLKSLTGQTFQQGPVCEGVYAVTPNVTLTADAGLAPFQKSLSGPTIYPGAVGISVASQPTLELPTLLTRLMGATEEYYKGAMYLGLDPALPQGFVSQCSVPDDLQVSSPTLTYRLRLLGRAAGQLPPLVVTYQILPRPPAGIATPVALPTAVTTLTTPPRGTLSGADYYVEADCAAFAVNPGDLVFLTVSRAAPDGYSGQVGVLEQVGLLAPGS